MKKNILAICDKDAGYAKRLMENINSRASFPFEVSVFTNADLFYKKLMSGMIEIGIVSESLYSSRINCDRLIAVLDEGEGSNIPLPRIWKYQSAEDIRKAILDILSRSAGVNLSLIKGGRSTNIISFFSPIKRCLQTSMALSLAEELAKNKNVLFVSLESFSGVGDLLDIPEGNDVTDLMYFYKKWGDKAALKLEGLVTQKMGFDLVPPANNYGDLSSVETEDWIGLIDFLKNSSTYDYVLLDLQEGVQGVMKILCRSRYIFTITSQDRFSKSKLEHYKKWLGGNEDLNILDKTEFIDLPQIENLPEDPNYLGRSDIGTYVKECLGKL